MARGLGALMELNFFMADVPAGIGAFLGAFLVGHCWHSATIRTVMTLGGVADIVTTTSAWFIFRGYR